MYELDTEITIDSSNGFQRSLSIAIHITLMVNSAISFQLSRLFKLEIGPVF